MPSSALAFWWMNELCAAAFAPVPVLSVSWMTRYSDLALLSRTGACALGKKVGHHRNILNVGQTGVGLRLAEHDLLCQHARRKRHDHQSDRQHQADPKSLAFLFACHDSPCLLRITSSCFFHCTTFCRDISATKTVNFLCTRATSYRSGTVALSVHKICS